MGTVAILRESWLVFSTNCPTFSIKMKINLLTTVNVRYRIKLYFFENK